MDDVVDQENSEKAVDNYDPFVGAEVCLLDERWRKMISRVTKRVKYNKGKPRGIEHPIFFADQSLYEVSFPSGQIEYLKVNVIAENMLSHVDLERHN